MDDKKYSLHFGIIKRDILRHWPIWTLSFLIYLFTVCFINAVTRSDYYEMTKVYGSVKITDSLIGTTTVLAVIMGLVASWAAFGYLGKKKMHYFYESLPFSRKSMFINRFIFGFSLCMLPCVAIFLVELVQTILMSRSFEIAMLLKWLLSAICEYFFWYSLGVMFFVLCGRVLMAGFCYGAFSVAGIILNFFAEICSEVCYIGYNSGSGSGSSMLGILSPLEYVFGIELSYDYDYYEELSGFDGKLFAEGSVEKLLIILIAGVVVTGAAYLLYSRRKSERTGDTVVFTGMKYVFSWCISFGASVTLTVILFMIFCYSDDMIAHRTADRVTMYFIMAVTGFMLYLCSCMIVEKRFRVFKQNKIRALAFSAFLIVFSIGFMHDIFNIEGYVPKVSEIKYISVNNYESVFELYDMQDGSGYLRVLDSESMEMMTGLHKIILENMDELEKMYDRNLSDYYENNIERDYYYFSFVYRLKNNKGISRSYIVYKQSKLDNEIRAYLKTHNIKFETEDARMYEYDYTMR